MLERALVRDVVNILGAWLKILRTHFACKCLSTPLPQILGTPLPYGVPNACIMWISPKMLCLPILASFADSKLLDFSQLVIIARYIRFY